MRGNVKRKNRSHFTLQPNPAKPQIVVPRSANAAMLEKLFDQLPIFYEFSPSQRDLLEPLLSLCDCSANEVIFEQGEDVEYLFILIDGEVAIRFKPDDGEAITVAHIKKGGVFGWSAAFGRHKYTSGAACVTKTRLLRMRGEDLRKLRQNHPKTGILILERLAAVVVERMQSSHAQSQVVAMLEDALKNGIKPIGG